MISDVWIPRRASSAPARFVSAMDVASACSTNTNLVCHGSRSAASARSYLSLASAIAAAGPMQVWPAPDSASAMLFDHASGSSSRRTVWPVGAVSKITRSNASPLTGTRAGAAGSRKSAKRSNAATSAVQGPASCSSMTATICSGKIARIGASVAVGVLGRRLVRVDLHRPQAGHRVDRRDRVPDGLLEDVGEVGRRVGRHDQDALAGIGLGDGGRAGHRRLADAALAREEEELDHRDVCSFGADQAPAASAACSSSRLG